MRNQRAVSQQIKDPDVRRLASIASLLQSDYEENEDWMGSPFAWIKTRPSRQVGKIGEQLVSGWCAAKGLSVGPSGDTEADKVIQGRRVEIKFSTLWKSGVYNFQQIRDQDYDFLLCLGWSPFDARCWVSHWTYPSTHWGRRHRHVLAFVSGEQFADMARKLWRQALSSVPNTQRLVGCRMPTVCASDD